MLLCLALVARADVIIPAGASWALADGAVILGCTDVVVGGLASLDTGEIVNGRNVSIDAGGVMQGGRGMIALSGNWTVAPTGQFRPDTSAIQFDDNCGSQRSVITGNASFYDAAFLTSTGKTFGFAAGSKQTISHLLQIIGTASAPAQFASTAAGQAAFIDLLLSGNQQISHVGVTDVWATGQPLAPTLKNEGGDGNAQGWFGTAVIDPSAPAPPQPIPTFAHAALTALGLLLLTLGMRELSARRRGSVHAKALWLRSPRS